MSYVDSLTGSIWHLFIRVLLKQEIRIPATSTRTNWAHLSCSSLHPKSTQELMTQHPISKLEVSEVEG